MQYKFMAVALAGALGVGGFAFQTSAEERRHGPAPQHIAQADALTDGEIRKVDKEAKKITIKHGPIANLDMPGMTMVFQVQDPALLDRVTAGDKVKFAADKIGGTYIVTRIESRK